MFGAFEPQPCVSSCNNIRGSFAVLGSRDDGKVGALVFGELREAGHSVMNSKCRGVFGDWESFAICILYFSLRMNEESLVSCG